MPTLADWTYRVLRADQIQPGDVIKTTLVRVVAATTTDEQTSLSYGNGHHGVLFASTRVGVYRDER